MRLQGAFRTFIAFIVATLARVLILSGVCPCLGMRIRTDQTITFRNLSNDPSLPESTDDSSGNETVPPLPHRATQDDMDAVEITLEMWKKREAENMKERDSVVNKIVHELVQEEGTTDGEGVDGEGSADGQAGLLFDDAYMGEIRHQDSPEEVFCAHGHYCTSGILEEGCSHPHICLPCSLHPDGVSPSGLHCESCQVDAISQTTVCLDGVGCPSGQVVALKDDYDKKLDDKKKRLFCRPMAIEKGQMPGLCAANVQGGKVLASEGQLWDIRQPDGQWATEVVRLQPYENEADGKLPMYIATFAASDSRLGESSMHWAGSLNWAVQVMAFDLGKDDMIGRSIESDCDRCIWHIRDVIDGKNGLEIELVFNRPVTNPVLLEDVEDPPALRLSEPAIIALGACLDFMATGRRPTDISLQSLMLLHHAQEFLVNRQAAIEAKSASKGQWKGPETMLFDFVDKVSSNSLKDVPKFIQRFQNCPPTSIKTMTVPVLLREEPVYCVQVSKIARGARRLRDRISFSHYDVWDFLGEFFSYTTLIAPSLPLYLYPLMKSATIPVRADQIDMAVAYFERMAPAASELQRLLHGLRKSLLRRYRRLKEEAAAGVSVDLHDALEDYCRSHPKGFLRIDPPEDCMHNTFELLGLYDVARDINDVIAVADISVCRLGARTHSSEGSKCLPANADAPTCVSGESSWCMHNQPRDRRCCCAQSGMHSSMKIGNFKLRKATSGCVAYRLASHNGSIAI